MNKQIFGTYIAENRKQLGMTQAQLADRLHVTDKAVSKWETGQSVPDLDKLIKLADLFGAFRQHRRSAALPDACG